MSRSGEPRRILDGVGEPIFTVLPQRVLANLRTPHSENALLWNLIYPICRPTVAIHHLLELPVLWGTQLLPEIKPDQLEPYFWGYNPQGEKLPGLGQALDVIDGPGQQTEIDLFLLGKHNLVAVEAKHGAQPGRCQRYQAGRCPEVHPDRAAEQACRYWDVPEARFDTWLDFGERPQADLPVAPPCYQHYQLARTLLVGRRLADFLGRSFHLWLVQPARAWNSNRRMWLEFSDYVRDSQIWRNMRVLAWKELQSIRSV